MPGKVRTWAITMAAFGAGAATLGVSGMLLRRGDPHHDARLYPPGLELSEVAGVSIRRHASILTGNSDWPQGALISLSPRSVPDIIREIEDDRRIEVLEETRLPEGNFEVHCLGPREKPEVLRARTREAVRRAFGILWAREKRRDHVYVLTALPNSVLGFESYPGTESSSSISSSDTTDLSFRGTLGELADAIGEHLQIRVVDETGIAGSWQGSIGWRSIDPAGLVNALREKGLGFSLEVREVDVIVIRRP